MLYEVGFRVFRNGETLSQVLDRHMIYAYHRKPGKSVQILVVQHKIWVRFYLAN